MRYISTSRAELPELAKWWNTEVGYDPIEDSPEITRDELAELILEYARERLAADGVDSLPVVELKSVKINKHLSEETPCYSATAYVDGVKLCTVANRGHGGCDEVDPIRPRGGFKKGEDAGRADRKMYDALALVEWRFRLFSEPREAHGMTFFDDFETACMGALETWENLQIVRRSLNRETVFQTPELEGTRVIKRKFCLAIAQHVRGKYPNAVILNELPINDAAALFFDDAPA